MNIIESEQQGEKRLKRSEQSIRDPWNIVGVSEEERKGQREYLKDQMQKLAKSIERCEYKYPTNSINFQKDKLKETHTKTL